MTDQFVDANKMVPITPPPELVEEWANASARTHRENGTYAQHEFALATQAARWGADRELDACCAWAAQFNYDDYRYQDELRATRRPKPPNKKQRGLTALEATNLKEDDPLLYQEILNAIKGLPDD